MQHIFKCTTVPLGYNKPDEHFFPPNFFKNEVSHACTHQNPVEIISIDVSGHLRKMVHLLLVLKPVT